MTSFFGMDDDANQIIPPGPKPPPIPNKPVPSVVMTQTSTSQYGKIPTLTAAPFNTKESLDITSQDSDQSVVITTMKEDVQAIRNAPKTVIPVKPPVVAETASVQTSRPVLPMSSSGKNGQSIVIPPRATIKKGASHKRVGVMIGVFLLLVIAGGAGLLVYLQKDKISILLPSAPAKVNSEMIPQSAMAIVQYRLTDPDASKYIGSFWSLQSKDQPTIGGLLEGDPRLLLGHQDIKEFYYITLPGQPRPYLLVPHAESSVALFSKPTEGQVSDQNGWYIAHSVSVDPFKQALTDGSIKDSDILKVSTSSPYSLYVYLKKDVSQEFMSGLSLKKAPSHSQDFSLWSDLQAVNGKVSFHGIFHTDQPNTPDKVNHDLLKFVPNDALFAYSGGNFSQDVNSYLSNPDVFDQNIIGKPNVSQFLQQFNAPYLYYQQKSLAGFEDSAAIITIPDVLKDQLKLGDAGVEGALPSIIPLIIGSSETLQLTFVDSQYAGLPLKYVNITQPTRSLDYAISGNYLLLATSKDAMLALIDAVLGSKSTTDVSSNVADLSKNPLATQTFLKGITGQDLARVIPGYQGIDSAFVGTSLQPLAGNGISIDGFLTLPNTP